MRKRTLQKLAALALAGFAASSAAARAQTSINGLVYADFSDKQNKDKGTGTKSSDSGVGTDVKRFYFTLTHEFDSVWSAQFQSDIGDQGAKRYDVFVKKAYIKAKLDPLFQVLLGSANQPWIPFVDDITGFRYVEQPIVDRLGFGNSADWGVHVIGLSTNKVFNYDVVADNGRGYSNPTRSKSVDFEGRVGIQPVPGLNIAGGFVSGKRGLDTYSTPALHTATRFDGLAAYNGTFFHVGGEYFQAKNYNNVTTVATDKADGWSIWGSIIPTPAFTIFGRWTAPSRARTSSRASRTASSTPACSGEPTSPSRRRSSTSTRRSRTAPSAPPTAPSAPQRAWATRAPSTRSASLPSTASDACPFTGVVSRGRRLPTL
jgi:hypothetical protein